MKNSVRPLRLIFVFNFSSFCFAVFLLSYLVESWFLVVSCLLVVACRRKSAEAQKWAQEARGKRGERRLPVLYRQLYDIVLCVQVLYSTICGDVEKRRDVLGVLGA